MQQKYNKQYNNNETKHAQKYTKQYNNNETCVEIHETIK